MKQVSPKRPSRSSDGSESRPYLSIIRGRSLHETTEFFEARPRLSRLRYAKGVGVYRDLDFCFEPESFPRNPIRIRSRSICRIRPHISFAMVARFYQRRFLPAVMVTSRKPVPSRSSKRSAIIFPTSTAGSSTRGAIPWSRTPIRTCECRADANSSRRRCVTLFALMERMVCMPEFCRATRRRMAVCVCRNEMRSRFSTRSMSARLSPCSAELRAAALVSIPKLRCSNGAGRYTIPRAVSPYSWR